MRATFERAQTVDARRLVVTNLTATLRVPVADGGLTRVRVRGRRGDLDTVESGKDLQVDVVRSGRVFMRGFGEVFYGGTDEADLTVRGSGHITALRVWCRLARRCFGSGGHRRVPSSTRRVT
jgi:hypothetical protein